MQVIKAIANTNAIQRRVATVITKYLEAPQHISCQKLLPETPTVSSILKLSLNLFKILQDC